MLVMTAVFVVAAILWLATQPRVSRSVELARTDEGSFMVAATRNRTSLLLGLFVTLCGFATVMVGLVEAFSALEQAAPGQRAEVLSSSVRHVQIWGGLMALVGLGIGVTSIVLFVRRRAKLTP